MSLRRRQHDLLIRFDPLQRFLFGVLDALRPPRNRSTVRPPYAWGWGVSHPVNGVTALQCNSQGVSLPAHVTVTLEIEAELPEGAPDNVVCTVSENARTLKFKSAGFKEM
jgi:hypothetical protein